MQLSGAKPEHATVDNAKPFETPIGRHLHELLIQLATVLKERAYEKAGEPALLRRHGEIVPQLGRDAIQFLVAANIPRVQRLENARARARFNSRP